MVGQEYNIAGRSLVILIPAYDGTVTTRAMHAYADTKTLLPAYGVNQCDLVTIPGCALIAEARNELVHCGLKQYPDATDFLFIDADIVWKPQDVARLVAWGTNHHIVAGVYCAKQDSPRFIVNLYESSGKPVQAPNGLLRAWTIPAGFMLVRRHVFEKAQVPEYDRDRPGGGVMKVFFDTAVRDRKWCGEDVEFCLRMQDNGFSLWVDPTITLDHIGAKTYSHSYDACLRETYGAKAA